MKKKNTIYACIATGLLAFGTHAQGVAVADSIDMETGYANEVFYKLIDGTESKQDVNDWHIGFTTSLHSATIFTNVGMTGGSQLKVWPNGTNTDFPSVVITDTTGFSAWADLANDSISYEAGAFNQNKAGGMDYGWGAYDMSTHIVKGDSVYLLLVGTGNSEVVYKIDIIQKEMGTITLRYAKLEATASEGTTVEIPASTYSTKEFVFFNLEDGKIKDRELENWDLWSTKYHDRYVVNDATPMIVTGILINPKYEVAKVVVAAGNQATHSNYSNLTFSPNKNIIGQSYKHFDYATFEWSVTDTTVWYLKDKTNGSIWKWYPTKFETGGKTVFMKQLMHSECAINVVESKLCIDSTLSLKANVEAQTWSIADGTDFATIENGVLTGKKEGTVKIQYNGDGCLNETVAEKTIKIENCEDTETELGIEDLTTSFVDLYPNPANNNLTIVFDSKATTANISLKNQIGQVVFTENANTNSGIYSQTIDLSTLTSGMYFVEIVQNGVSTVKTIVKD